MCQGQSNTSREGKRSAKGVHSSKIGAERRARSTGTGKNRGNDQETEGSFIYHCNCSQEILIQIFFQEQASSFITRENIDQAIEEALANPVDYNFSIDLQGNIHRGRLTVPEKIPEDKTV
jgi:hypothetical protein